MSWEFVKRHRNKIAAIATTIGSAYVAKKVLDHQHINPFNVFKQKSEEIEDETCSKSKRHFIFDSHQQTCDKEVVETVRELIAKLDSRFDTEQFILRLQNEENMDVKEKVKLWEQMKIRTFARLLAVAYTQSIVLIALKTQKSILCRETIKNYEKPDEHPTGIVNYLTSLFTQPANGTANSHLSNDLKAQQVFLNCIHYLTTHGLSTLYDRIEKCTSEVLSQIPLTKKYDAAGLKAIFEKLNFRLQHNETDCNFSDLVVPVINSENVFTSGNYNAIHLEELLGKLSTQLQSPRAGAVLSGFVQRYINETVDFAENKSIEATALAKLIPILNDAYAGISSVSYNSILQQNIASSELYQFCQMADCRMSDKRQRLLSYAPLLARCSPEVKLQSSIVMIVWVSECILRKVCFGESRTSSTERLCKGIRLVDQVFSKTVGSF
ncbi:Peroxisomal assembly protein PEX3 [Aphelenchoides besseyi]|nr:Peroxisomal assembly protein PEX3 [Aphelenchoides besseyi]